jgi:hypothetical protein
MCDVCYGRGCPNCQAEVETYICPKCSGHCHGEGYLVEEEYDKAFADFDNWKQERENSL